LLYQALQFAGERLSFATEHTTHEDSRHGLEVNKAFIWEVCGPSIPLPVFDQIIKSIVYLLTSVHWLIFVGWLRTGLERAQWTKRPLCSFLRRLDLLLRARSESHCLTCASGLLFLLEIFNHLAISSACVFRCRETLKNAKLCKVLVEVTKEAGLERGCDKNVGALLYFIASKVRLHVYFCLFVYDMPFLLFKELPIYVSMIITLFIGYNVSY